MYYIATHTTYTSFNISETINLYTPTYLIAGIQPFCYLNILKLLFSLSQVLWKAQRKFHGVGTTPPIVFRALVKFNSPNSPKFLKVYGCYVFCIWIGHTLVLPQLLPLWRKKMNFGHHTDECIFSEKMYFFVPNHS